jgi:hypothetical protein
MIAPVTNEPTIIAVKAKLTFFQIFGMSVTPATGSTPAKGSAIERLSQAGWLSVSVASVLEA